VLGRHLGLGSETLLAPLTYNIHSRELLKASILIAHGHYEEALQELGEAGEPGDVPTAKIARYIAWRETGKYEQALCEIGDWARCVGIEDQLRARLSAHEAKFKTLRFGASVGSPALLLEQRLLAQDALKDSTEQAADIDLRRYFHQNPKNINIESGDEAPDEDLFFRRVSLTSC
jgi:hypothetical protein